ncbi:MAG: hypothetical protein CMG64_04870 [Candidatus Marinimicrobia bacterium]|nr:hypothetical protein [Candidatus Neomarinimicrobiota bacterium]
MYYRNFQYQVILCLSFLFIFSCSKKKNINASSDFLAYYNTFYMANDNFNKAMDIIDKSEPGSPLEKSTIILLDKAIDNALIIENDFYDTKYLDDAYYIIARSSFLKGRITASNFYFNELIDKHENNDYYYESMIWTGFLDLLLGDDDKLNGTINYLDNNIDKIDSHLALYYKLKSEIAKYYDLNDDMEKYLLLSLNNTKNNLKKIYLLKQMLLLAESNENYINSIKYINLIEKNLREEEALSDDLLNKWFDYNRLAYNYSDIYDKIDEVLSSTMSITKEVFYKKQLAITLYSEGRIDEAKDIYSILILDYITDVGSKLQFCEINYNLGNIYLYNFNDLEQAKYYLSECKQFCVANNNKIKKIKQKSSDISASIIDYLSLKDEFEYSINEDNANEEDESDNPFMVPMPQIDSQNKDLSNLLYDMSLILLFDLNLRDLAIMQLKKIDEEFVDSNFHAKSLFLLSELLPNEDWKQKLNNRFPEFLNDDTEGHDSLINLRINAWDGLNISSKESITRFKEIFKNHIDTLSLYNIGYIYDEYERDIDSTIKYYQEFVDSFPNHNRYNVVNQRIIEIENIVLDEIKFLEKKILFSKSFSFIHHDSVIVDSALKYLSDAKKITINMPLNSKIQKTIVGLETYKNNLNLINIDTLQNDSLMFETAEIALKVLLNNNVSKFYYKKLLNVDNDSSKFSIYAKQALNYIINDNSIFQIDSSDASSLIWESPNEDYLKNVLNNISELDMYVNQLNQIIELNNRLFVIEEDELPPVTNLNENTFKFNQSTKQYFYFVEKALIDEIELLDSDWMVAYNNDVIVGSRKYVKGGMVDIPIMGFDDSSESMIIATDGYCFEGDMPIIKVYRENGSVFDMKVELIDGSLKFEGIGHANVNLNNR